MHYSNGSDSVHRGGVHAGARLRPAGVKTAHVRCPRIIQCPFLLGDLRLHRTHASLGTREFLLPKRHSIRSSAFARLTSVPNRQTTERATSLPTGRSRTVRSPGDAG